ncbi:MAG TPA: copper-containing nitrite reductase [Puia sp.]|nr:copper-containing nitrite reductase [Puia sp.]
MKKAHNPQRFRPGAAGHAFITLATVVFLSAGCNDAVAPANFLTDTTSAFGEYNAELAHAPSVPPAPTFGHPEKVIVHLEVVEKVMQLADGVNYTYWTFGGSVPGPMIRVTAGDEVEMHLSNDPNNKMPHNIDLHAVCGPGGGAEATLTVPGHTSIFSFRALKPGLYVYHCATAPVGMHIANGMYGMILVDPKEGYPAVDKEFYLMQGEFYTKGKNGQPGLQPFDMDKAIKEQPEYVVFNGSVGGATGTHALRAKVGDRIRIFVGNGGPNLVSSFHIIGQIFDRVYEEGGNEVHENIQTTVIPAGGSAIVEFTCREPGVYSIVDHSIFRAFNKGALAQLVVTGPADKTVYSGKIKDELFQPGNPVAQSDEETAGPPAPDLPEEVRYKSGHQLFDMNCSACHQNSGLGMPGAIPPLAKSDFLMNRSDKGIGVLLNGIDGEAISVNGKPFQGVMPNLHLSDQQIADILTYVRNSWGNKSPVIQEKEVRKIRNQ